MFKKDLVAKHLNNFKSMVEQLTNTRIKLLDDDSWMAL